MEESKSSLLTTNPKLVPQSLTQLMDLLNKCMRLSKSRTILITHPNKIVATKSVIKMSNRPKF